MNEGKAKVWLIVQGKRTLFQFEDMRRKLGKILFLYEIKLIRRIRRIFRLREIKRLARGAKTEPRGPIICLKIWTECNCQH